jgi:hypothetical protein
VDFLPFRIGGLEEFLFPQFSIDPIVNPVEPMGIVRRLRGNRIRCDIISKGRTAELTGKDIGEKGEKFSDCLKRQIRRSVCYKM